MSAMTPNQYANEVIRIVADGTVPIGVWSQYERDFILNALIAHRRSKSPHLELIVDDPYRANFRLVAHGPGLVWLADYRRSSIGRKEAEDVSMVNEKLARIGVNS